MGISVRQRARTSGQARSSAATRRRLLRGALAIAAAGVASPAFAQNLLDRLMEVLRSRVPALIPGTGAEGVATADYIAEVFTQIWDRNKDDMADLYFLGASGYGWTPVGTAAIVIEIDAGGRLIDARMVSATGQGRSFASRAIAGIRRAAPFAPPRSVARDGKPIRIAIDETFIFDPQGKWHLKSFADAKPRPKESDSFS